MRQRMYRIALDLDADETPVGWSVSAFGDAGERLWVSVAPAVPVGTVAPEQALADALDTLRAYGLRLPLPIPDLDRFVESF